VPVITFGTQVCADLDQASRREWLLADGVGGYAMGTVGGLRTRRYHGLLTIAETPSRRSLAVAALDPVLVLPSGVRVELGVHEWADRSVAPRGHALLERFDLIDGLPRWRWRVGEVVLERELAMTHGSPGVAVSFRQVAGPECELQVRALVTWRDSHGERRGGGPGQGGGDLDVSHHATGAVVERRFRLEGPGWEPDGRWYRDVFMREESARGLPDTEDLWSAGTFRGRLMGPGSRIDVRAWALGSEPPPAIAVIDQARARASGLLRSAGARSVVEEHLTLAADAFVIAGPDVIAGYPWFGPWSRDAMISFEGLFLLTGRAREGRELLVAYGRRLSEGMLPNTADTGAVEFNTVDGTLWFVHALDRYLHHVEDGELASLCVPWLLEIIDSHVRGTRFGIGVSPDGLLTQGHEGVALTWMDARIGDLVVTPRHGKPVEVGALWINAMAVTNEVLQRVGRSRPDLQKLEATARRSFARRFSTPSGGLLDVVDGPFGDDGAVRPHQALALSLPHGPGADTRLLASLGDLLTPLGLRSLHPADPGYLGRHTGDQRSRDLAYHQGTVWPWLVGPYVEAAVRLGIRPVAALDGLSAHLGDWGLGSVSETASGDAPHEATGAPFQAWSVAETLRAWRMLHPEGA